MGVKWICALFLLLAIANIAIEATPSKPETIIRERRSLSEFDSAAASMVRKKRAFAYSSSSTSNSGTGQGTTQTVTSGDGAAVVSTSTSGNPSGGSFAYSTRTDPDNPGQVIYTYTDSTGKKITGRAPAENFQTNDYIKSIQAQQATIQAQIQSSLPTFYGMNNFGGYGGVPNFFSNNFPFANNDVVRNGMSHGPSANSDYAASSASVGSDGSSQYGVIGSDSGETTYYETAPATSGGNYRSTSSSSSSSSGVGRDGKRYSHKSAETVVNDNGKVTRKKLEE
ncbi:uncharacterized serine-rich protein C215.13-like isoform X2 [Neodiprion fabricii]|uniref:uncharacterized serine-rich protein C215.13-like isoform X2 n=1 Tax=Neodiprion fabricii TaxID=2872261 RepID=UPI001ED92257|nr:uncharacterized serine-rich protein C215.13-like isoform X2 [Neodiprion fabricii]